MRADMFKVIVERPRLGGNPDRVEALLPDRWGQSHPEHVLTHRLEESREKARRRDARRAYRRKRK